MSEPASTPTTLDALNARMIADMDALPRRLADGARYLIDHPDDVVISSMREIAARAGVAPATLVRLARSFGFADWSQMRALYTEHLRTVPARYADKARAAVESDKAGGLMAETFRAQEASLAFAAQVNPPEAFTEAARTLAHAKRVYVAAFMSCRGPGLTFTYLCKMLRPNVELLGGEGSSLVADLSMLEPGDAVLSINFQPYGREIAQVGEAVQRSGADLISLSDSRATPLQAQARTVLLYSAESPSFFPSIVSAVALVESLAGAILAELRDTATDRINRIEEQLYASGSYQHSRRSKS
ncbi:MurR/RpiR family transcriptional regulator [Stappia indica]|uniref:MurR/RpiR family transcriptional regulator n=1 Tax=Stappia indica TaxID=538381 RepID=UPI001CD7611B|nr:MurR/RpiR family transcriptional regulator [Stappia indica]MCA1296815.1 MurR/RpiR family transcriptional regulator [Stappia indica]